MTHTTDIADTTGPLDVDLVDIPSTRVDGARTAAPSTAARATILHRLLGDALRLPAEYAAGLTNHLPMALAALDGLGADEARLRAFFATYATRFTAEAPPPSPAATCVDWTASLGRFEAFEPLRAHFAATLAQRGTEAVLRAALPVLLPGVGGAAFHGVIRTAHAVESGYAPELAAALAYWAARWLPLGAPPEPAEAVDAPDDATAWLDALDARLLAADAGQPLAGRLIVDRMRAATGTTAWRTLAGRRVERPLVALADLARAAAARYAATGNFTVLHLATAARAAGVLAAWLPRTEAALAPLWHAVAAASLASGVARAPRRPVDAPALAWREVRARARASDDDHVIKLVHAMSCQVAFDPDPVWLAAARVAVAS